jgi:hypothetical protein
MLEKIEPLICAFRKCFRYKATFFWFVIVVFGFLVRCDHHGVTSFIRWLFLHPGHYESLLHFFRSGSWQLEAVLQQWVKIVINRCPIVQFKERALLIGDGIKLVKEAKKMPIVKSLKQDSDNSGKAEFIRGHHFGYVGILAGSLTKAFCCPLHGQLHEGVTEIRAEEGWNGKPATIVTRMVRLVVQKAQETGKLCYVALDAYFAVGPAFLIFRATLTEKGEQWVHLITRAKGNYVAYWQKPPAEKNAREEQKVHLMDLFQSPELFEEIQLEMYGQIKMVSYFCADLYWPAVKGFIRFVFIQDGQGQYVLMSSDLELPAPQIITIYSYRFKIEVMFFFLKHLIGGFKYHFWTRAMPKLKRGQTLDYRELDEPSRKKCLLTIEAIERFVNLAGISLGLLQILSLTCASQIWSKYRGWIRTISSEIPSEEIVQNVLKTEFFAAPEKVPTFGTLHIIQAKQDKSRYYSLDRHSAESVEMTLNF